MWRGWGSEIVHWGSVSSPMKEEPCPSMTMNYLALIEKPFMWSIKLAIWCTDTLCFFPKDLTVLYAPKQFSRLFCNGEASVEYHRPACWPSAGRPRWATAPSLIHNLHKRFRHGGDEIKHLLTKGTACHFHTRMQSNRLYLFSLIGNWSPYVGAVKGKPVDSVISFKLFFLELMVHKGSSPTLPKWGWETGVQISPSVVCPVGKSICCML